MRFRILHRTQYDYAAPVRDSFNELRLKPLEDDWQRVEYFALRTLPAAVVLASTDFNHNTVHHFDVTAPHSSLQVESEFVVQTAPRPLPPPLSAEITVGSLDRTVPLDTCFEFLQTSAYVDWNEEVWKLALDATAGIQDVWEAARLLCTFVHTHLTYTPQSTSVRTHMRDVLVDRRGVCQDFAHVLLGLCRSIRLPARYVSGYLAVENASATHAWVEVYLPTAGWFGLDPTHNVVPDATYIRLAIGRDYGDVAPVRGHYRGTQQRTLSVDVRVETVL